MKIDDLDSFLTAEAVRNEAIERVNSTREESMARKILAAEFAKLGRTAAAEAVLTKTDNSFGIEASLNAMLKIARRFVGFVGRPLTRELAYTAIDSEREYQIAGRGNAQRDPDLPELSLGDHLVIIRKLLRDAEAAWYKPNGEADALNHIRKIGGVAVSAMEIYGAPERE